MGKEKDDGLRDREPVELLQDWGDVVTGTGGGEKVRIRVLYVCFNCDSESNSDSEQAGSK